MAEAVPDGSGPIAVIGVAGERFDSLVPEARLALASASLVVGGRRLLDGWQGWAGLHGGGPETLVVGSDVDEVVRQVQARAIVAGQRTCVLASGDPGFFGILRALLRAVDRRSVQVFPAPSSVSLAFARLGLPWDDAVVVSAHGRPLADAIGAIRVAPKVAVLTSPDSPPEALGQLLTEAGVALDLVAVCSQLATAAESVTELRLEELAKGRFDPLSVVVLIGPGRMPIVGWTPGGRSEGVAGEPPQEFGKRLAWGLPDRWFGHRDAMITKAEVRAVVLGKLALPRAGVLWDLGAGSGSVAIECALLCPGLTVLAVERSEEDAARISANALAHGAGVHVVTGEAPAILSGLPDPDRVFVGGGGLATLSAALERLRPAGQIVATFAALDRAAAAAERLGHLVQVGIDQGERLPDGGWRLAARNPVFVAWGPDGPGSNPDSSPDSPAAHAGSGEAAS